MEIVIKKKPLLLDIGCGPGFFLKAAGEHGFIAEGIDVSLKAVEYAENKLGVKVYHNDLLDQKFDKKYDIIHMKTFLEHVDKPLKYLDKACSLLNENGIIYIEGPNDFNILQKSAVKILKLKKWWIDHPHHLSYITCDAMKKILHERGFSIFFQEMTFPVEILLFLGINYIRYPERGKYVGKILFFLTYLRNKYKIARKICSIARRSLTKIDIGRRYVFYARKERI